MRVYGVFMHELTHAAAALLMGRSVENVSYGPEGWRPSRGSRRFPTWRACSKERNEPFSRRLFSKPETARNVAVCLAASFASS
jgi:hypothetical protein